MIKVELSEQELVLISMLSEAGVFNIRNGSATLHFDNASLASVEIKTITFKKRKVINTLIPKTVLLVS